jgi:hypothetical protein
MDTYALTIKCGLVKYWDVFNQQWDTKTVQDVQYTQSGSGNFIFPTFSPLDRDRIMAPIYFDKCPKCAWNNGPGRKKAN